MLFGNKKIKQTSEQNQHQTKNWRRDNLFPRHSERLATSIDALESSAAAAWRWNQEGGELKLKQVRRTPAAPRFEETFPGLRSLQINGRCDPEGREPGDARVPGRGGGDRARSVLGPCFRVRRRGAWSSLSARWRVGGRCPRGVRGGAVPCACVPHLEVSDPGGPSCGLRMVGGHRVVRGRRPQARPSD